MRQNRAGVNEPCSRAPGASRSLVRVRLTDRRDLERVHTHSRVVDLELAIASVDHVHDSVDCMTNKDQLGSRGANGRNAPVREVSAMLVATMHFRRPSAVASKILAWRSAGIWE